MSAAAVAFSNISSVSRPGLTRSVVVPGVEAEAVTFPGLTAIWKSGLPMNRMLAADVEPLKFASPE